MGKAVIQLETLTCPSCKLKIEDFLVEQEGVRAVDVLFNTSKLRVEFDNQAWGADALAATVEKLGYEVKDIKTLKDKK
ncbi:MAG: heavy metal-associated domain-containing protein [Atopococcus tabaci]|uniref:Heavy metal-associated domain-containing protein n=1 Tax=Atopococcus tabaci TaxID=269774 RepID=A0AA43UCW0_9LACT|nr:heavy metal-associated domain-containing protein [Atopococcus tabaci]